LKHSREERFPQPTKPETRSSNPNLARGKIGVQIVPNLFYEGGLPNTFVSQRLKLAVADFDQGEFGDDKEPVQDYQRANCH
jgi:hypothetical protein